MDNLHERPQWDNIEKSELTEIIEIENPKKQLWDLKKIVIEHNRKRADQSLRELEEILHITEGKEDKNNDEIAVASVNSPHNPLNRMSVGMSSSKEIPPLIETVPTWIQWAAQWTKESLIIIGKSIKKLFIDIALLPSDIYHYFKKRSKKIG